MKKKNLSKLVALAVLLGGVTYSGSAWADPVPEPVDIIISSTGVAPTTWGGGSNASNIWGAGGERTVGQDVVNSIKTSGDVAKTVYGILSELKSGEFRMDSLSGGIDVKSTNNEAYGISLKGTNSIFGLGSIKAETAGTNNAYGIYADNGTNTITFTGTDRSINAKGNISGRGILLTGGTNIIGNADAGLGSIMAEATGLAYGIYATGGVNTVTFTGAESSITAKSSGNDAYGISATGTGTNTISGLGNITAETTGGSDKFAYGIYAKNTNTDNTKKFSVAFDSANGGSISAYSVSSANYGILFAKDSTGTSEVKNVKTITAGVSDSNVSTGQAYGIFSIAGVNTVEFVSGSSIKAKSSSSNVYGIKMEGTVTTTISGLGSITAENNGFPTVYGIYSKNTNTAPQSQTDAATFSVSFDSTNGGTISAYSASGANYGIRFDTDGTGKTEVKNVKTITAGISGNNVSSGSAYGIKAEAGVNTVTFTGADSSIKAKSGGSDAYGIYCVGGSNNIGKIVDTKDYRLGSITATTSATDKNAYGIFSAGTDTSFANNVSFKGNGGQAITATNTTTAANAYSISAEGKGATTVTFESSILSGKIKQDGDATLTLNFNNGGVWNYVKDDVTGNVSVNVNNGGTIVFDLPATTKANDTIFTTTGTVTIADTGTIRVINGKATQLQEGDEICLIDNGANITLGSNVTKQHSSDGITWSEAEIYTKQADAKKLMYKRTKMGLDPDGSKAPVEGMAAAAASVNTSSDLVTGAGMANMITSTAAAGGGAEPFAAASFGSSRLETGSHVDSKGYGIVVGVGKKVFNKAGNKTTGGIFVEYGNSDTDTYNNAVTGSGKSINKGVGYMMRYDHTSGNYYEGMIHAGKINSSWSNSTGGYSMSPTYFGGALTYGHKFMVAEDRQLSVYGSYIYGRTGGGDAKIAGYDYSFGATNSHRTKVGVRYAMSDLMDTKKFRPYIGLAWEREYKGDTVATVRGFGEAPSPSMKGNSGILEIGCKQEVGKWTLGIGAEVFTGKRKGWNGTLQATYNF